MADIVLDAAASLNNQRGQRSFAWASASVGYFFFIDADGDFKYVKTTDGGATWGSPVTIYTGDVVAHAVWFDKWTPGDSGTIIHTAYVETDTDDIKYRSLDTSGDSLGTQTTVFAGNSAAIGVATFVSIAKMQGGNFFVASSIDNGAEGGFFRSTDSGATWGARGTGFVPLSSSMFQIMLVPGNEADTNDCYGVCFNLDTNSIFLKTHDDSANTNSSSSSIVTVVESAVSNAEFYAYSVAQRYSDNHFIIAVWTGYDVGTADFRVFDLTNGTTWSELTAIATDKDDSYHPAIYVDDSNKIYVAYNGKRDGSETLGTATGIYYVSSTDGGSSWSAGDTAYSTGTGDRYQTWAAPNGPRFMVGWRDISSQEAATNFDNSIATGAGISASLTVTFGTLTVVAVADLAIAASATSTLGALSVTAVGDIAIAASATPALGALAITAVGDVAIAASAALILDALTVTAVGDVAIAASATPTFGALVVTAVGDVAISVSAPLTLDPLVVTAVGDVAITASATPTLGALTVTAVSDVAIAATLSTTLGALIIDSEAVIGNVPISASLDITLGALQLTATATNAISGTATAVLDALTLSAVAELPIAAQVSVTLGELTVTSTATVGSSGISADLNVTLGELSLTGSAVLPIAAQVSVTLGELTLTSAAELPIVAQASVTLGELTITGVATIGSSGISADFNIILGELSLTGSAVLPIAAQSSITLGALTLQASASGLGVADQTVFSATQYTVPPTVQNFGVPLETRDFAVPIEMRNFAIQLETREFIVPRRVESLL